MKLWTAWHHPCRELVCGPAACQRWTAIRWYSDPLVPQSLLSSTSKAPDLMMPTCELSKDRRVFPHAPSSMDRCPLGTGIPKSRCLPPNEAQAARVLTPWQAPFPRWVQPP